MSTDKRSKRMRLPLIKRLVGVITYEHCLTERFYGDIYMSTAERNYYVDQYHEVCLCAHYNRCIPGTYQFDGKYQFFVTKERMCLDIYWNLGNISDETMILEKYDSIKAAEESKYYGDFLELVKKIEAGVEWKRTHFLDPFKFGGGCSFLSQKDENGRSKYIIYEIPIPEEKVMAQFYLDQETETWDTMSISPVSLCDLMQFLKNFNELDEQVLHLRNFISLNDRTLDFRPGYRKAFEKAKSFYESSKNVIYC